MKKYHKTLFIIALLVVGFGIGIFAERVLIEKFFSTSCITSCEGKQFIDAVNGWSIRFPADVDDVQLVDDLGPNVGVLDNVIFGKWILVKVCCVGRKVQIKFIP
jgi:hypothetical protein